MTWAAFEGSERGWRTGIGGLGLIVLAHDVAAFFREILADCRPRGAAHLNAFRPLVDGSVVAKSVIGGSSSGLRMQTLSLARRGCRHTTDQDDLVTP